MISCIGSNGNISDGAATTSLSRDRGPDSCGGARDDLEVGSGGAAEEMQVG